MNLTPDLASSALRNPSPELKSLLNDPRVPAEAREALQAEGFAPSSGSSINGSEGRVNGVEKVEELINGAGRKGKGEGKGQGVEVGGGRLQVIDENQNFSSHLNSSLSTWQILTKGFAYDVVAVFGSQSTGKSTLLNGLFGTEFDVMDEKRRRQTTKGIWLSPSKYSPTLVMDVEGTDGRERGEDQDFERKSALFSLAATEVLLVNLWEHQVGLYQGANMGLLKTVFEVNLGLFGGAPPGKDEEGDGAVRAKGHEKTLLMFVIRDFVGGTPLESLSQTLTQDMEKIWQGLSKPDHLKSSRLSDYFDLTFAALPHKILAPEKFEEAVVDLRGRFTDSKREDYVFRPGYHKRIPADGVAFYMEGIWQQVLTNKDLDLPTQQELLAQFRCDEIGAVVLEQFEEASKGVRKPVDGGHVVEGLGGMMGDWRATALSKFDKDASRYHPAVYSRKRLDLLKALENSLTPIFLGQLKNLHKKLQAEFKVDLEAGLKKDGYDFGELIYAIGKRVDEEFVAGAKAMLIKDTKWQYEDELELLRQDLELIGNLCRSDELKKTVNAIERSLKKQLIEPVEVNLAKPSEKMWDSLMITFKKLLDKAEKMYTTKAKGFNSTPKETETSLQTLRTRAYLSLHARIMEQLSDHAILARLRDNFEESFRYDRAGVPRVWIKADDIDGEFKRAKDATLDLIPLYANINITDPSADYTPPTLPASSSVDPDSESTFDPHLLSASKQLDLSTRFKKDADAYYVEAKRSVVTTMSQIPGWMYGLLLVLGRNDIAAVVFNPLQIIVVAVLGAAAYLLYQLGMVTPLIRTGRAFYDELQKWAIDKLRDVVRDAEPQAARIGVRVPDSVNATLGIDRDDVGSEGVGAEGVRRRRGDADYDLKEM